MVNVNCQRRVGRERERETTRKNIMQINSLRTRMADGKRGRKNVEVFLSKKLSAPKFVRLYNPPTQLINKLHQSS